jgi:hypothetical protein
MTSDELWGAAHDVNEDQELGAFFFSVPRKYCCFSVLPIQRLASSNKRSRALKDDGQAFRDEFKARFRRHAAHNRPLSEANIR